MGRNQKDKNIENGQISLLVDGTRVYFSKGMGAHASSQLTYDVSGFQVHIPDLFLKWESMLLKMV